MDFGPGLVLTRKVMTSIAIDGGRIIIQVVSIRGKQVRLKFVCDKGITIDRLDENGLTEKR